MSVDEAPPIVYPKYFQTIVSVAPDKMKFFRQEDMKALVDAFHMLTDVHPLTTDRPLADVLREFCRDLAAG